MPRSPVWLALALGLLLPALSEAAPASGEYTRVQADADLSVVVAGKGQDYLRARGRLSDHPRLAHDAALTRLEALDARVAKLEEAGAYSPEAQSYADIERERGRVIAVLGEAKDPADAPRFASRLRAVLDQPNAQEDWQVLLEPWRGLLLALGPAAVPELTKFVADTKLEAEHREFFLQDLVAVTPVEGLAGLCQQLGAGDRDLERALRRALVHRAREDRASHDALIASLEASVASAETPAQRRAAAILLRDSIGGLAPQHAEQLVTLSTDEASPFDVRAAALLTLAEKPEARAGIETLASDALATQDQRGELLAWLALQTLPVERQAALEAQFALRASESPRLAALGWRSAQLSAEAEWLDTGVAHAWPEVRRAAVERVGAGCAKGARKTLRRLSGPQSQGGSSDEQFARATLSAMGRCGDLDGLRDLVQSDAIGFERRGVAAAQLVQHDPQGALVIAALLEGQLDPHLGERFATALANATAPVDPKVVAALCHTEATNPTAASSARRSRKAIAPDASCPTK